ncbi:MULTISPECIES: FlgO family outer membrane protein [Nitratidesulfovibrio]|uniref:FlgO domain-containing protein n=1 Tax=Nitratidesulfovibrio vulgaris (strain DSM 19637 / Miyazaki F) TaxID=883 RepID=B8DNL7_NITV9|nr:MULTISPECIES: FlgO family outer membrane protein [Nitratidesulfovibrio]MBZ2171502.1 hypothetical protein [Nitratidesulfovibrio sp. SRB-5]NHZ48907.1 hypothetical protein [Nitratidesulfovibrio liaohensis]RXF78414.1 hypothetical protein EKK70_01970 [Desulfovibrio sp. DS-1]
MKRILALLVLTIGLLLPLAAAAASVPEAADAMAAAMDVQMARKLGQEAPPAKGISIMVTTPVDLGDLEGANGLARQMAEEMSRWFVQAGYRVQEIRKGRTILFQPETGELLLTRKTELLGTQNVSSVAILAGTYTITPKAVRFNMRLIHTPSNEVLAMGTATVPVSEELRPLLVDASRLGPIRPSVGTSLR